MNMKRLTGFLFLASVMIPLTGFMRTHAETPYALISKVVQQVTRKSEGRDWVDAQRGETLTTGDALRTGKSSFSIVKFKDNSMVRVRELSELTIQGAINGGAFSKSVELKNGSVGFNIRKQADGEEFQFSSPTSVASIRGTGGQFTLSDTADILIAVEGTILFTNEISRESMEIRAGYTGVSRKDGIIFSRLSTDDEKGEAEAAASPVERGNEFEFDLRDAQGNKRKLKIDFK